MFDELPPGKDQLMQWVWADFEPYYEDLAGRWLNQENVTQWLKDWSLISRIDNELYNRLYVATTVNTADEVSRQRFEIYMTQTYTKTQEGEQVLKEKLLESGLQPEGFDLALRNMRAETELFCTANLPLLAQEEVLNTEYDSLIGAQTISWNGTELTLTQMRPLLQETDRSSRERVWRLAMQRRLKDQTALADLWQKLFTLRQQIASNAGYTDYLQYRWRELLRFDYTPEECRQFRRAIEQVVVPAATRIYQRRCRQMQVDSLRPWDLEADPLKREPLRPFDQVNHLVKKVSNIFHRLHPELGAYFDTMQREGLLDLENRKDKAPGGYCTEFAIEHQPFIFANAVGIHNDVVTLIHEGGHAFHVFESAHLPYFQQLKVPMEFAEVASMAMELLSMPYLDESQGGFYTAEEANRARVEQLERAILFWPYMAVVDAFQHWAYTHPQQAAQAEACDKTWAELWDQFMPGEDWSGLEAEKASGWQRKEHIFAEPFYYIEYGLAQLGAVLVWENALHDQAAAVDAYRRALSLGATCSLPDLYRAAGALLTFEANTLKRVVELMEMKIEEFTEQS